MLLATFLEILSNWQSVFPQQRTYKRAVRQAIGSLICLGRKTLTRIIWTNGGQDKNWSSEYFLHSRSPWSAQDLFRAVLQRSLCYCRGPLVGIAVDDTRLKKTGKRIKQASMTRDPMSPPFHVNFMLGIRFLQFAVLLPLHRTLEAAARSIPIRFEEVTAIKRPRKGRKNYDQEMKTYREISKTNNLSTRAVKSIIETRKILDDLGATQKLMVIVGDGSFCNRRLFGLSAERTHLLVRARKDAKLCKRSVSPRYFYDQNKFTPQQVLEDPSIAWIETRIFYGGKKRLVRYKELTSVYWQTGAKRRPLRLFIVAPTPYRVRKTGRLRFRDPGFLLTTIFEGHTLNLLQLYFDRWQIEVNHRDEKQHLGVGHAQLHNFTAVPKQPAFVVAAYSALVLAALTAFGPLRSQAFLPLPRWRANAARPSCLDLLGLFRKEVVENKQLQHEMGIHATFQSLVAAAAA
jgi:DDE superfamily endonuclease